MEQYIPYSLICDLFSRNLETFNIYYRVAEFLIFVTPIFVTPTDPSDLLPQHSTKLIRKISLTSAE